MPLAARYIAPQSNNVSCDMLYNEPDALVRSQDPICANSRQASSFFLLLVPIKAGVLGLELQPGGLNSAHKHSMLQQGRHKIFGKKLAKT